MITCETIPEISKSTYLPIWSFSKGSSSSFMWANRRTSLQIWRTNKLVVNACRIVVLWSHYIQCDGPLTGHRDIHPDDHFSQGLKGNDEIYFSIIYFISTITYYYLTSFWGCISHKYYRNNQHRTQFCIKLLIWLNLAESTQEDHNPFLVKKNLHKITNLKNHVYAHIWFKLVILWYTFGLRFCSKYVFSWTVLFLII